MRQHARITMSAMVLVYAVLGFGLVGCDPDDDEDIVHVSPSAVQGSFRFRYGVENSTVQNTNALIRLGYVSYLMPQDVFVGESTIGCFGTSESSSHTDYRYDDVDYEPLQQAVVLFNDIQLVYREELSYFPSKDFRKGYASFTLPSGVNPPAAAMDSIYWSAEVDGWDVAPWQMGGSTILPDIAEPELPDSGTVVHPSDAIPLDQAIPTSVDHFYFIYESSDLINHTSHATVYGDNPDASADHIRVRSEVLSDTLWLVCRQVFLWGEPFYFEDGNDLAGAMYEWVRPLVVEQN